MHITRSMGFIQILAGLLMIAFAGLIIALPEAVQFAPVVYDTVGIPTEIPSAEQGMQIAKQVEQELYGGQELPDNSSEAAAYMAVPNPQLSLQIKLLWEGIRFITFVLSLALAILLLTQGVANTRHGIDESKTSKVGRGFQLAIGLLTLYLVVQFLTKSIGIALIGVLLALGIFVIAVFDHHKKHKND